MSQSEGASFIPCCPEEDVASLCSPVQFCTVTHRPDLKSDTARKQFKHKLLKEKPETLFTDLYKTGEGEDTECASTHSSTAELSAQEQDIEQDQLPSLYTSITLIKEHFTQLEVELVYLQEMVLKQEQDKDLKHERDTYRKELDELKEQVGELQKDREKHRDSYRKEMAVLREELKQSDSTVQSVREQLLSSNQQQSPLTADTSTQTNLSTQLQPPPSTSTSTSSQKPPPPSTPTSSQQSPPSQQVHLEPRVQDTNRAERRTTDQLDIALLIDSNSKFTTVKNTQSG
ncbi:hypothetical protein MHYP_G00080860 [Metynnis hypsauchen]